MSLSTAIKKRALASSLLSQITMMALIAGIQNISHGTPKESDHTAM
jgi:hypothetical protein